MEGARYAAPTPMPDPAATTRPRRKPGEARRDVVEAAREAFIAAGYHGASLRQIAIRAGTTQAVLYRYFPSKADLFRESVLKPFETFVNALVDGWRASTTADLATPELIAGFTEELYDFTRSHRGLMLTLIAAEAHDDNLGDVRAAFSDTIQRVVAQVLADREARGWTDIDAAVAAPLTMAMIIAAALLDEWLFPAADRPDRERILTELTRYEIRAITGANPGPRVSG